MTGYGTGGAPKPDWSNAVQELPGEGRTRASRAMVSFVMRLSSAVVAERAA
jgi:hypothetical protein